MRGGTGGGRGEGRDRRGGEGRDRRGEGWEWAREGWEGGGRMGIQKAPNISWGGGGLTQHGNPLCQGGRITAK